MIILKFYKIRYILHELYVPVLLIISQLIICIDQLNTAVFSLGFSGIPCELLGTLSIAWNFHGISLFPIKIIGFP